MLTLSTMHMLKDGAHMHSHDEQEHRVATENSSSSRDDDEQALGRLPDVLPDARLSKGAPHGARNGRYLHGMKGTPEWKARVNARRRCTDSNHPDWKNYGGRGITMCAEWLASFAAFYAHIGPRPAGLTLDRRDNDRGYEPGNVRWATRAEQNANKRRQAA